VLYRLSYLGPMANRAGLSVGGAQDTTGFRRSAIEPGSNGALEGLLVQTGELRRLGAAERRIAGELA
jgi:hypothetical protein